MRAKGSTVRLRMATIAALERQRIEQTSHALIMSCVQQIVLDCDRVEHLLLRTSTASIAIRITGARVGRGLAIQTFVVSGFAEAEALRSALQKLYQGYRVAGALAEMDAPASA